MEAKDLETWQEKPALGLVQSREDAKNMFIDAVKANFGWTALDEKFAKLVDTYFSNLADTDKKLAEAFAELHQLRHTAHKNRLDGMLAVKGLVDALIKKSEVHPKQLAISFSEIKNLHESIDRLVGLNLPRTEEIENDGSEV